MVFIAKIRRLYDIANILTSLHLIEKVHVTELRGRKPAFQYIGPNVDDIPIHMPGGELIERPLTPNLIYCSLKV